MLTVLKRNQPFRGYGDLSGIGKIAVLIGFLLVENNITGLPNIGALYYVVMFAAFFYLQSRQPVMIGSRAMIGLYIVCVLSIIGNNIPAFFSPWARFSTFLLITALVSPWLTSGVLVEFRLKTFVTIMRFLQFVVLISFVYALLGQGYTHIYFQGITNHSMMLGPFCAMCILYCLSNLISKWDDKTDRWWYLCVLICALYCLLQTGSRTSFLGTLLAVMMFFAVYYNNALGKYVKVIGAAVVVLMCTYPLWGQYMDKLEKKNVGGGTELNINSREDHWKQRVVEFESSPIIGIGFCSVDVGDTSMGSTFDASTGKVETGSSWLSILSMTGALGFLFFLSVFLIGFSKAWKLKDRLPLLSGFLIAMLCFWSCHMIAEGYVFAGGNSLAFCMWITLGVIYGVSRDDEYACYMQQELIG